MKTFIPTDRSVVAVTGEDAGHFLQNLVTCNVETIPAGVARAGALLTPQGKIMWDFLVFTDGAGGFRIDIRADAAADFMRRLTMYKLRAKVEIAEVDEPLAAISWQTDSTDKPNGTLVRDNRFPESAHVWRHYGATALTQNATAAEWDALRIAHGVAESGSEYELGDAFPHDVSLDQNAGVDFAKGCYVGQEVVSRMQHRGTARRRIVIANSETSLPAGATLEAGGKTLGTLGASSGTRALGVVRLDRAKAAMDAGIPILAAGRPVALSLPPDVGYRWPEDEQPGEE